MPRARSLTTAERWDVGLLMSLLVLACACGALVVGRHGVPKMLAETADRGDDDGMVEVSPPPRSTSVTPAKEPTAAPAATDYDSTHADAPSPPKKVAAAIAPTPAPKADVRYYQGKKYRFVRTLRLRVTAYSADPRCCWPYDGSTTASGLSVKTNRGRLVAADTRLIPMHSIVSVPGYSGGDTVPVLDRGGKIQGHRLDILLPSFEQAKAWGSRVLAVKCYEPVD